MFTLALNNLRPQLVPTFAMAYAALMSESSLLELLKVHFEKGNVDESKEQNICLSKNVLGTYRCQFWDGYAQLLKNYISFMQEYC